jgi:hypothetical protein
MMMPASVQTYLYQWLSTAGEFSVDMAWQTNRMQLRCKKCSAILRVPQLEKADEMPFVLQDWVSMHGYNGNHGVPVPVTADFKSLPIKHGLPIQAGGQTGQMLLESMLNATEWANATEIIKAVKAPPARPEPVKRANAHIAKGRRFR